MFIKLKEYNEREIMLNVNSIVNIIPYSELQNEEYVYGCYIECACGNIIKVKESFQQLEYILQPNSIEKEIERLKTENFQLRMRKEYEDTVDIMLGRRKV